MIFLACLFALGLCVSGAVMMGCDKKPEHQKRAVEIMPPEFSVTVTLSKKAQAKLQELNHPIYVYARFADDVGPAGFTLGDAEFYLREPGTVHFKDIQFPQDKIAALPSPDYEVLVNVTSGSPSSPSQFNRLDCDLLQDQISAIQRRSFTITCDLSEEQGKRVNAVYREKQ